jgi:hypothetical protein
MLATVFGQCLVELLLRQPARRGSSRSRLHGGAVVTRSGSSRSGARAADARACARRLGGSQGRRNSRIVFTLETRQHRTRQIEILHRTILTAHDEMKGSRRRGPLGALDTTALKWAAVLAQQ